MSRYVFAFESTHAAIAAQAVLSGIAFQVIPTPREISAGCGMSLLFDAGSDGEALSLARSVPDAQGLSALYRKDGSPDGADASAAYASLASI